MAFSSDGRWAISGSDDTTLRLWDLSIGRCLRTFHEHIDSVQSVAFNQAWGVLRRVGRKPANPKILADSADRVKPKIVAPQSKTFVPAFVF